MISVNLFNEMQLHLLSVHLNSSLVTTLKQMQSLCYVKDAPTAFLSVYLHG